MGRVVGTVVLAVLAGWGAGTLALLFLSMLGRIAPVHLVLVAGLGVAAAALVVRRRRRTAPAE
ncbi:hypothetical protein Bcav_2884 [Beutenbergia cavernae DSM 12333]|uniref:Uncharacterized protein n=1 Tax=Beutenbergia cavernae (strain ATCC BAA-8 / DSM 12333 / CCUG 43141 / JCM 11478 / NBRC 16432 / NCIMB 13614 / HKI 0122) TaxID=471853 RepID=C5BZ14_BEUC1|nr:hypothetical protein [Beutenbergia cavernae]ACQ81129.1 hypothetical protein Bcav_2884 [Beutenbergia cavernae DSM 12333]